MKDGRPYTYTVLRYVHDVMTAEFVNVGVILHVPSMGLVKARIRPSMGPRLRGVFPDLDRDAFTRTMRAVEIAPRDQSSCSIPVAPGVPSAGHRGLAGRARGREGALRRNARRVVAARAPQGRRLGARRIAQSYVPPEAKDDKALNLALDLLRGIQSNPAFPPNAKAADLPH